MPNKKHLRLLSERQLEKIIPMKYVYGFGKEEEDEDEEPKNYYRIAQALSIDRVRFDKEIQLKRERKDTTLEIPYNIDIKGKHMRNTTTVDRELIENMYHNAFRVAETGNQGKGLPPPMSRRVTQKKKMDSYLLCEFQDAEDKTYFMKWLPLEDAIEVSSH